MLKLPLNGQSNDIIIKMTVDRRIPTIKLIMMCNRVSVSKNQDIEINTIHPIMVTAHTIGGRPFWVA